MHQFHPLVVERVKSLTPNSVAVTFAVPDHLKGEMAFIAGQYITIKHPAADGEVRRAYSISSAPHENKITVGIKKVKGGTFSVFANETLKAGDVLHVMAPEGRFVLKPSESVQHIAAFAAGSGITPIMSIVKTALNQPEGQVVLLYGNQNPQETMFFEELQELKAKYTDRFFIQYIFSRTHEEDSLYGRIEGSTVNFIVKNKFRDIPFHHYFLCGPQPMIETVQDTLLQAGVPKEMIHYELFTTEDDDEPPVSIPEGRTQLSVTLDDEVYELEMDRKNVVLDAVLNRKIEAPYSCQGGICSTCIARITEGKAEMEKNQILTDSEIEEGFILTCQAHPLTPTLKIDYDDV